MHRRCVVTFLLTIAVVCLLFAVIFGLTDRYPDDSADDEFVQPVHCHVTDKEPTRT
jgi:hypothetical protein